MSFSLFFLYFYIKAKIFIEEMKVISRFYSLNSFRACDLSFKKAYFWHNPYRISKTFLFAKGIKNIHQYGETPLTTLAHIANECALGQQDLFIELGCGRGRGIFFLSCLTGCQAHGIEWIPLFVQKATRIADQLNMERVSFSCQNMLEAYLEEASFLYLYGTCMEEEEIHLLVKKLEKCKTGTKVVSISYPLTDYSSSFYLKKEFDGRFPWGIAKIYLQEKY